MAGQAYQQFNWVDFLAITLLVRMGYVGFQGGLYAELVKLCALVTGFFVSFRYFSGVADLLAARSFLSVEWAAGLAMVALTVGVYLLLTRFLRLLEKAVQVTFQERVNRVGGLLAGFFRAGLVASVILVVCRQLPSPYLTASIEERSYSGRWISRVAPALYDATAPWLANVLASLRNPS